MFKNTFFFLVFVLIFSAGCRTKKIISETAPENMVEIENFIIQSEVGAADFKDYLSLLKDKRVGLVANQASVIYNLKTQKYTHIVDTLLNLKINITKVFSPEHGFRGTADAGELVKDEIDVKTGLKIVSLYGDNKKPKPEQLTDLDYLVFDLQDVGVRFYTYISSLHYVMEAAAEQNIPLIVLDRPNPNIHYIDGPVLDLRFKSFVGMHPVPVVYGMSIGEYALMINGEKWLQNNMQCDLTVVEIQDYTRETSYDLPFKPSPNLPNATAINLYPSLCFFEGTTISCGRGTKLQFQIFGSPLLPISIYAFEFIPKPNEGSKNPLHNGKLCFGLNLDQSAKLDYLNLQWLIDTYQNYPDKKNFFIPFFNTLAGNDVLQKQIESGKSIDEIKKSWKADIDNFKKIRRKYLLYP